MIERNGTVIGSSLIGQEFKSDRYFHGRPSATTGPDPEDSSKSVPAPYNAANSMGSNLGPTSQALVDRVHGRRGEAEGGGRLAPVPPVDLVTTSASGLDPHISSRKRPCSRFSGWPRPATCPEATVRQLVNDNIQGRLFGVLGEPRVNVLALNLALDRARAIRLSGGTPA